VGADADSAPLPPSPPRELPWSQELLDAHEVTRELHDKELAKVRACGCGSVGGWGVGGWVWGCVRG